MDTGSINSMGGMDGATKVEKSSVMKNSETMPTVSQGSSDKVEISPQGAYASSLIYEVSQMEEVRSDKVVHFKDDVQKGLYPPPSIVKGITYLIGNIEPPEEA